MKDHIKIPLDRVAVLVGPNGSVKKLIEEKSTARLDIDSKSGDVEIGEPQDPIKGLRTKEVVQAVARVFSPEKAIKLLDDEFLMFEMIDLSDIARSDKDLLRIKGRIIGKDGRTREVFESLTDVRISVYGKTISMIGYPEHNAVARAGIDMLLKGSAHGPVYKFLEKKKSELKRVDMGI